MPSLQRVGIARTIDGTMSMMRLLWGLAAGLVALAGCVAPRLSDCGDGTSCPLGYACTSFGCASPEQLAACQDHAEGEPCALVGVAGACRSGGCVIAACGNSFIDDGELCDDGNIDDGDGCSSTCTSNEVCGNGAAELAEECDCGDEARPGAAACDGTYNGQTVCTNECTLVRTLAVPWLFTAFVTVPPPYLHEGLGSGTPHQPVPIYVDNIDVDDVITIRVPSELGAGWEICGQAVSGEVALPLVAPCARGERSLAFTVSVPISTTVGAGGTVSPLEIVATRGARVHVLSIPILPLDELSNQAVNGLFSRIQITAPVTPAKNGPALLWRATADIEIGALVDLRGTAGAGTTGTGGCSATGCAAGSAGPGNTQVAASSGPACTSPCNATPPLGGFGALMCASGGGCAVVESSSAGGGGHATVGATGTSACGGDINKPGGAGGSANADPFVLVPTGGGGGAAGGTMFGNIASAPVTVYGGGGGGGGGVATIDAKGEMRFLAGGQILANGGSGGAGGYTACSAFPNNHQNAGDGGGGAGGSIRLRAESIVIPAGADLDNLVVAAGGGSTRGGAGANGRTRVDGLGSAADTLNTSLAGVVRGPDFATPPPVVRTDSISLAARSRSSGATLYYGARAASADRYVLASAAAGAGTVSVTIPLDVGLNEVCVFTGPQSDSLFSAISNAAKRCAWVARVP